MGDLDYLGISFRNITTENADLYYRRLPNLPNLPDARVGTIAGGTSEIMKEIISKIVVDRAAYRKVC